MIEPDLDEPLADRERHQALRRLALLASLAAVAAGAALIFDDMARLPDLVARWEAAGGGS